MFIKLYNIYANDCHVCPMLIESGINVTRLYEDLSQWHSLTVNINKRTCKNNDTNKCNFIKKEETMVLEETKERKHIQFFFV